MVMNTKRELEAASTYVEQHKIFQLFEGLMQDLIVNKPEDPLEYMIRVLKRSPVPKVVVAGPPGAEARRFCELLAAKKGVVHVVASDVWRELVRLNSEPGLKAKALVDAGQPIDDALLLEMLKEKLTSGECVSAGWVLEGYPSTASQARSMATAGLLPTCFLHLTLSDAEIKRRLTGRRVDPVENKVYHLEDLPPPDAETANRLVQREEDLPAQVDERTRTHRLSMAGVLPAFSKVTTELDATKGTEKLLADALPVVSAEMPTRAPRGAARVLLLGGPGSKAESLGAALAQRYGAKLVSVLDVVHAAVLNGDKSIPEKLSTAIQSNKNVAYMLRETPYKNVRDVLAKRLMQDDVRTAGFVLVGYPNSGGEKAVKSWDDMYSELWFRDVVHLKMSDKAAEAAVCGTRYDPFDGEVYHIDTNMPASEDTVARLTVHPNHTPAEVKKALSAWNKNLPSLLEYYAASNVEVRTEDAQRPERELVERLAPCFLSL